MTELSLTDTERKILDSYKTSLEGLGAYLGEVFEFVLHDLSDLEHSVIKIINGHHSGRKEGAPITDLALSMLERINANNTSPYISYISKSKHGRPVKSTTIVIFGENKRAIGMICINLYLDSSILSLLEGFTALDNPVEFVSENFINDSEELIVRSLEKVKHDVNTDPLIPLSHKNKEIISILYYQGIFKLKSAVRLVSHDLNLSKNTVYLHIRALEESKHLP
ncbi:MAG: PAS domain-containing protein [Treponema sp.]|jgi:predicted transcriptional regulator YheO|nr:PAS domain-containing protein [Treponema sp.]